MADSTTIPLPVRSILVGALSGARTFTPLAVLAVGRGLGWADGAWHGWPVLRSPVGRTALVLAALGELAGDKVPSAPPRTTPLPLLGRMTSGAVAGAALGTVRGTDGWRTGAALGAAGAVAGAFAGRWLRAGGARTGLPDWVFAVIEDAATVASAAAVVAAD